MKMYSKDLLRSAFNCIFLQLFKVIFVSLFVSDEVAMIVLLIKTIPCNTMFLVKT